ARLTTVTRCWRSRPRCRWRAARRRRSSAAWRRWMPPSRRTLLNGISGSSRVTSPPSGCFRTRSRRRPRPTITWHKDRQLYPGYALGLSWPLKGHHLPELAPEGDAQLGKDLPRWHLARRRSAVGSRRSAAERPISTEVLMQTVAVVTALAGAAVFWVGLPGDPA